MGVEKSGFGSYWGVQFQKAHKWSFCRAFKVTEQNENDRKLYVIVELVTLGVKKKILQATPTNRILVPQL